MPFDIYFKKSGRGKAQCQPDPKYPNGRELDVSFGRTSCVVDLPYPAKECGAYVVTCSACKLCIAVTAAGRPDDPTKVTVPCRIEGAANA